MVLSLAPQGRADAAGGLCSRCAGRGPRWVRGPPGGTYLALPPCRLAYIATVGDIATEGGQRSLLPHTPYAASRPYDAAADGETSSASLGAITLMSAKAGLYSPPLPAYSMPPSPYDDAAGGKAGPASIVAAVLMSAKEEADLEELLGATDLGIGDVAEFEVQRRYICCTCAAQRRAGSGGEESEAPPRPIPPPCQVPAPANPVPPSPPQARLSEEHDALEAANVISVLGSAPMVDSVVFQMRKLGGVLGERGGDSFSYPLLAAFPTPSTPSLPHSLPSHLLPHPSSEDLDENLVVLDAKLRHMREDISAIESSNNTLELQARNNNSLLATLKV